MEQNNNSKPTVFLDRDGTLVEEVNYLSRVEDLRLFPFTAEALRIVREHGFLAVVVTNQSGIGRGIYDEAAMHSIHEQMQIELSDAIDGFYFCPHLPCDGCTCRKPGIGMIESAMNDLSIDLSNSWMIGDKISDIETGFNAGIKTALVRTGYGQQHSSKLEQRPDIIADDLLAAVSELVVWRSPA